ncbi:unnamed protein product [Dracunculus medinensis]|uniref:G_PROTEIN_RECEP_F1_2 domain-containing protein n=1 Tax=Dracunculus medinensis TaxID=318479 RepID=A0A0N4UEN6_DRAME|nr:unnamed protein product [Dracunculus medinensis]
MSQFLMGIPIWACYVFGGCFLLIIIVLLLDYLLIRRNALGHSCLQFSATWRHYGPVQPKRSTNILLSI